MFVDVKLKKEIYKVLPDEYVGSCQVSMMELAVIWFCKRALP